MYAVFIRTILIYVILLITMRLMGKRQVGEMHISELVITLMLSELAASPITNRSLPILNSILPILLLVSLEIITSFLLTRSNLLKRLLNGSPILLVKDGVPNLSALSTNRIEIDELLAELRQKGAPDLKSVRYAILEDNGKLSVFLTAQCSPPTAGDLSLSPKDNGIAHEIIIDGEILDQNLTLAGKDRQWLEGKLKKKHLTTADVFLMTVDDGGEVSIIRKEKK